MMEQEITNPVEKAASILGGVDQIADAFSVSPQAVYKWINKKIPANRCLEMEKLTNGEITRHQLRPDIFGEKPTKQAA